MIDAAEVLRVLSLLRRAGIETWVDGGWGVDALLGEQTRPHDDLDIALRTADLDAFIATMAADGYLPVREDGPYNVVLADGAGHEVDAHLVDLRATRVDHRGIEVYGPDGLAYEVGALAGAGVIGGVQVACCTAAFQVSSHTGYDIDADDVRDVMALHRRFGIPLPPEYAEAPSPPAPREGGAPGPRP